MLFFPFNYSWGARKKQGVLLFYLFSKCWLRLFYWNFTFFTEYKLMCILFFLINYIEKRIVRMGFICATIIIINIIIIIENRHRPYYQYYYHFKILWCFFSQKFEIIFSFNLFKMKKRRFWTSPPTITLAVFFSCWCFYKNANNSNEQSGSSTRML